MKDTIQKIIIDSLPKEKIKSKLTTHEQTWYMVDGYNQALKDIASLTPQIAGKIVEEMMKKIRMCNEEMR